MITCPQCGAQNLPGMAYCENCGSPLPQQASAVAPAPVATAAPVEAAPVPATPDPVAAASAPSAMPPIDQSPAPVMSGAATYDANAVAAAAPVATGAATLSLTFPNGQVYTMQGDEVNIGRADAAQDWHPELDVIPFGGGAPDLGVSRHQARLLRQGGGYVVVDMGSTNGTYVNGRAATYNQEVPLSDGDTLSFGALNTKVAVQP